MDLNFDPLRVYNLDTTCMGECRTGSLPSLLRKGIEARIRRCSKSNTRYLRFPHPVDINLTGIHLSLIMPDCEFGILTHSRFQSAP
jgi:hypothetical protein